MTNKNGIHTYQEIMSQGEVWERTLQDAKAQVDANSQWLQQEYGEALFTGCGSTYYLSLSAARHWKALTNRPARALPASELWLYPEVNYDCEMPLLIAISRSGETSETIKAIEDYEERYKRDSLVVSCYPQSVMAKRSNIKLLAGAAQEESVAQTRSFASMFLLVQYLAGRAAGNETYLKELLSIPQHFSRLVDNNEATVRSLAEGKKYNHFVFLGSGLNHGLANEAMLKMKEISISVSEAFHFMEFRHGPMSMITEHSLVVGLMSDSRKEEENRVLQDMKKLGATTLAIAEDASGVDADHVIALESGAAEAARSVLNLPLLQLLAYHHSISKGLNPDRPFNLEAVVRL